MARLPLRAALTGLGAYLVRYAQESAWGEDSRRMDNGSQVKAVMGLAIRAPTSVDWCGYWQRACR